MRAHKLKLKTQKKKKINNWLYPSSRYQDIWVDDDKVLLMIDITLPLGIEFTNDMNSVSRRHNTGIPSMIIRKWEFIAITTSKTFEHNTAQPIRLGQLEWLATKRWLCGNKRCNTKIREDEYDWSKLADLKEEYISRLLGIGIWKSYKRPISAVSLHWVVNLSYTARLKQMYVPVFSI